MHKVVNREVKKYPPPWMSYTPLRPPPFWSEFWVSFSESISGTNFGCDFGVVKKWSLGVVDLWVRSPPYTIIYIQSNSAISRFFGKLPPPCNSLFGKIPENHFWTLFGTFRPPLRTDFWHFFGYQFWVTFGSKIPPLFWSILGHFRSPPIRWSRTLIVGQF
jgi:hypothetical protein